MRLLASILFALTLAPLASGPAAAQCNRVVHVVEPDTQGAFTGTLEKHVFPGPPNWEDITKGDRPLTTYLLRLDQSICANDGEVFANVFEPFDTIHITVKGKGDLAWPWLSAHVGQTFTLSGQIFAAQTADHLAPLVMMLPADWKPPAP